MDEGDTDMVHHFTGRLVRRREYLGSSEAKNNRAATLNFSIARPVSLGLLFRALVKLVTVAFDDHGGFYIWVEYREVVTESARLVLRYYGSLPSWARQMIVNLFVENHYQWSGKPKSISLKPPTNQHRSAESYLDGALA
jgi:hypothetical protein